MNRTLTKEILENTEPGSILFSGIATDGPGGLNIASTGRELRYVVVRGAGIPDWAVYCHWSWKTDEWIRRHGDKVHGRGNLENILEFDDETWAMYRP